MRANINTAFISNFLFSFAGVLNLKLTKVSIPSYKLRGESAILECIYELNQPDGHNPDSDNDNDDELTYSSNSRYNSIVGGSRGGKTNIHRDGDHTNYGDNNQNLYRRIRSYTQPQQQQHRNYHQSHYQQPHQYQQYKPQQQNQSHNPNQQQPPPLQLQSQTQPSSISSYGFHHDHHMQHQHQYQQQQQQHYSYDNSNEKYDDESGGIGGDEHHSSNGESLYAVKWYKDNEEFYRYVPKANPQKQSYRVDGVRVIVSKIAHHIYIINIYFYTLRFRVRHFFLKTIFLFSMSGWTVCRFLFYNLKLLSITC